MYKNASKERYLSAEYLSKYLISYWITLSLVSIPEDYLL